MNSYTLGSTIAFVNNVYGCSSLLNNEAEVLLEAERCQIEEGDDSLINKKASKNGEVKPKSSLAELRAQMQMLSMKRRELSDKAALAFQRRMYAVASFYAEEAKKYSNQIESLSENIVQLVLEAK